MKTPPPSTRGGKRPGAGRKLGSGSGAKTRSVKLTDEDWEWLRVIGDGDRTAAVRGLIRRHKK